MLKLFLDPREPYSNWIFLGFAVYVLPGDDIGKEIFGLNLHNEYAYVWLIGAAGFVLFNHVWLRHRYITSKLDACSYLNAWIYLVAIISASVLSTLLFHWSQW